MLRDSDPPERDDTPYPDPVEIPIEDSIDLHLFTPRDVKAVVLEYLVQAAEKGFAEVRIIHGRGIGERKRQVEALLKDHPLVIIRWLPVSAKRRQDVAAGARQSFG